MAMKTTNVQQWFNTTSWVAGSLSYTSQQNLRNIYVQTNPSAGTQLSYTYSDNVPFIFIIVGTVSGGTATVILSYGTGTDEKVYQQTSPAYAINSTFNLTTTWQRFTWTATVNSSISPNQLDRGLQVFVPGANITFYVWGAQLEVGSTARGGLALSETSERFPLAG